MDNTEKDDEFSIWNINSIIDFVKNNFIQILLFILVFVIIYVVDHVSNINAMIYSMPSPVQIPGLNNGNKSNIKDIKNIKNIKNSRNKKK
jgi:hypothetical protein